MKKTRGAEDEEEEEEEKRGEGLLERECCGSRITPPPLPRPSCLYKVVNAVPRNGA